MKTLLVGINAKYSHSCLAIDYLESYCRDLNVEKLEFNINQPLEIIYREILDKNADRAAFSVYIWNVEFVKILSSNLKKALPEIKIIWGGPEVSFDTEELLKDNISVDFIIRGEGEETLRDLIDSLNEKNDLEVIKGISYRNGNEIYVNEDRELIKDLDSIPSPFINFSTLPGKTVYYEMSRGCPFKCSYCLSSTIKGVRYFSKDRIKSDILEIIKSGAKVVKLVDRTFNSNEKDSVEFMNYIIENAPRDMCFHMELMAHLITDDFLDFLRTVPKGLFQFEIGIQSSNMETLRIISRITDLERLKYVVRTIRSYDRTHQHVDLIAGLPYEDLDSFKNSFNYAYSLGAEKLQLGFLKLLRGSNLRYKAEEIGIIYSKFPPYEVIRTKWMSPKDLSHLKLVEDVLEKYSNEDYFNNTLNKFVGDNPYEFFSNLSKFWKDRKYHLLSHRRVDLYEELHEFLNTIIDEENFAEFLRLDFIENQNINPPAYLKPNSIDLKLYHDILKDGKIREKFGINPDIPTKKLVNSFRFEKFSFNGSEKVYGIYYSPLGNIRINITEELERIIDGLH